MIAHKGKYSERYKINIESKILEEVSLVKYLGCNINFERDKGMDNKNKLVSTDLCLVTRLLQYNKITAI